VGHGAFTAFVAATAGMEWARGTGHLSSESRRLLRAVPKLRLDRAMAIITDPVLKLLKEPSIALVGVTITKTLVMFHVVLHGGGTAQLLDEQLKDRPLVQPLWVLESIQCCRPCVQETLEVMITLEGHTRQVVKVGKLGQIVLCLEVPVDQPEHERPCDLPVVLHPLLLRMHGEELGKVARSRFK
jgi:hypothetical protein